MAEVFEVIERIQYIVEDKGLKEAGVEIQNNNDSLIDLAQTKEFVQRKIDAADKKDIENQKKLQAELKKINDEIVKKNKIIEEQAASNRALNSELKKEIGLLESVRRRLDSIQAAKGVANTEKEVAKLNKQLAQTQRELEKLEGKGNSGRVGGFFQSMLTGFGIGTGMQLFQQGMSMIQTGIHDSMEEFKDAEKTALSLQRALKNTGNLQMFDGLVREADKFSEVFKTIDNDDIIKVQTQLINYGKVTRNELSKLTPVVLELARAEGIDFTQATETVINILEGRGGATLRQYGISVKGVKSEHERLNIVLGQLYDKVKGSNAVFEQTLEGQKAILEKNLANIEENFGASFARIRLKVLPILSSILDSVNNALKSSKEKLNEYIGEQSSVYQIKASHLSDTQLKEGLKKLEVLEDDLNRRMANLKINIQSYNNARNNLTKTQAAQILKEIEDQGRSIHDEKIKIDAQKLAFQSELNARSKDNDKRFNNNPTDSVVEDPKKVVEDKKNVNKAIIDEEKASAREIIENREARDWELAELDKLLDKSIHEAVKKRNDEELDAERKAAKERLDARRRGDQEYADLARENIEAMDRMADDSIKSKLKKVGQVVYEYSATLGQLSNTIFGFISDSINTKIDKLSITLDTAQNQLLQSEKIADRGNADLYNKQVERVQKLEAEREKARNNELEYTQIQNALNSALAFTQALLVVTNAGATGDPYTIAARIGAAVAALGAAYSFAQSFKQAKHGLDDSREGERGSDRLSLPSPNGEDYFGKLYHLANGEAVIQNWDGTADKYRPAIKAMRRGTLPEWINDLAMGKPLPLINNKAIQDAVVVIQQESNGDMKAMQEMMKDLLFMIGNMELNSTVLSDNGMFNNYRTKLANLKRRKTA